MLKADFKYKFERSGMSKGTCPQCNKHKVFRFYEGLPREFGKCERLNNCGYHNIPTAEVKPSEVPQIVQKPQIYLDATKVEAWLYNQTSLFHTWAIGLGVTPEHLRKWNIGTTERGETVFIFQNKKGEWWNAKFFQYTEGGSRNKDIDAYSMKSTKEGRFMMCLFGEQLLSTDGRKVCIVESEKTAVIASFFYPQYDFVACGSNQGLTDEKVGALVGRRVLNLRDADIAGRSTCSLKKLESCTTPLKCKGCRIPAIEKRLTQWKIQVTGLDAFPTHDDGYDLADAIRDDDSIGAIPDLEVVEQKALERDKLDLLADQAIATLQSDVQQEPTHNRDDRDWLRSVLPYGVNITDVEEYGFYEYKNRYYMMRKGENFEQVSNFIMRVRYLIQGVNPKRIVEITNVHKKKVTLDMAIEDLISPERFKMRIESHGNFLFEGKQTDLSRIKNKLYSEEKPSLEISTLGQYKERFYAFGNGIYDFKDFYGIDDEGFVAYEGEHFYIPVMGNIQAQDDDNLLNYKKFIHMNSAITFKEWAQLFCDVYDENGKIGIAYLSMSLFRDIIFEKTRCTPMLFLFGQRGSGKGTMANSMLYAFGKPQDPLMLGGASTVVGFMRKLGQFNNALVWLDEYKNDIGEKKIESLKNIWDGIGYERGVKDQSNRTQTSPIRASAIISGQEMPNVEPALFSRVCLCEFKAAQRSQEDVQRFNLLREMEDTGITNITTELLKHRAVIKEKFEPCYREVSKMLRTAFQGSEVIERQIINYSILIAVVYALKDKIQFPMTVHEMIKIAERHIDRQRLMMRTSNEVQQFFEIVSFLFSNKLIEEGRAIQFKGDMILIRMVEIFPLYRDYMRRQNLKPIDKGTLNSYLTASEAYEEHESTKGSHRFTFLQNPTSAMVFLHPKIQDLYSLDLHEAAPIRNKDLQEVENQTVANVF